MLGYHQSRWNYNDQQDVASVQDIFDQHNIPLDTIWLDIEYADDKRYFTWDKTRFPHPKAMLANLTSKGRNMIIISDTLIKKDDNYFVYAHMKKGGTLSRPGKGWTTKAGAGRVRRTIRTSSTRKRRSTTRAYTVWTRST
ncbi:hypothetical protein RvY_01879-4 [Ramazzottius varieornatus]|uniref:Glycoside hydrolase family 31 TIM barrel domain-containing protein n=1 Tax=Ramazzottius varieornatus TaxID=947166 RepID=A0A1D1ULN9_RAMVA|nr:hypothetical protein RvY_01879-4 [Ramazzottius varieornatus]